MPRQVAWVKVCHSRLWDFRVAPSDAIIVSDARPNRCTPDLRRPCELDAGFRGGRPRPCLLCAHRVSADSVGVDAGRLAPQAICARARGDSGKGQNRKLRITKTTYGNYLRRIREQHMKQDRSKSRDCYFEARNCRHRTTVSSDTSVRAHLNPRPGFVVEVRRI